MKFREIDEAVWQEWLDMRPRIIKDLAARIRPDVLYRLNGQRCYVYSYSEDGTLSVIVSGEFNRVLFSRTVFGVNPDDLVECELPQEGEDIGDTAAEAGYDEQDIREILIPKLKEMREP